MTSPGALRTAILAVVGLGLAVAVGLAANAISRDSIGLAPTPVGSGVRLAPAKRPATAAKPTRKATQTATKKKAAKAKRSTTGTTTTAPAPAAPAPTTTSGGDDHGGNRGSGGGGSGGGGSGSSGRGGGDD